jgi:hypothetical protein
MWAQDDDVRAQSVGKRSDGGRRVALEDVHPRLVDVRARADEHGCHRSPCLG